MRFEMKGLSRISLLAVGLAIFWADFTNAGLLSSFSSTGTTVDDNGNFVVTSGSSFAVDILIESDGSGSTAVQYFDFTVNIVDQTGTPGGITFSASQPGFNTESNYLLADSNGTNLGNQANPIENVSGSSVRIRDGLAVSPLNVPTVNPGDSPRLLARLNFNVASSVSNPSTFGIELVSNFSNRADASGDDASGGLVGGLPGGFTPDTTFTGIGSDDPNSANVLTVPLGGSFLQGVVAVPEPSSFLALCGLGVAAVSMRRKRSAS